MFWRNEHEQIGFHTGTMKIADMRAPSPKAPDRHGGGVPPRGDVPSEAFILKNGESKKILKFHLFNAIFMGNPCNLAKSPGIPHQPEAIRAQDGLTNLPAARAAGIYEVSRGTSKK